MKKTVFMFMALVLVLSLGVFSQPGAAAKKAGTPVKGGTLVIADGKEVNSLMWYRLMGFDDMVQTLPLYEALFQRDKNGRIVPFLLQSYQADPANLTYTFVLHKGIRFHDGSELTASVCKWNLDFYKQKGIKTAAFFSNIASFSVKDDYTVVAHLSAWDSQIPNALAREPGFMFSEKAYKEKGEEYCAQHPVGTGPFMLKSWDRDVSKTYVKFSGYWKGEPKLDKIEYRIYSDSLVAQAALQSGEVQVFFSQDYNQVADMAKKGLKIATGSIPGLMPFITYESTKKDDPFYDVRVRQAVAHAIDQKTLTNVIYKGYASPTNQFASKNSPYYSKNVVGYPYNLSKAKQLLAKAGYANGFSTMIAVRNDPVQVACATAIQAEIAKIGIKAKLNLMESGDFSVNMVDWKSGMWFHTTSLPPAIISQASSMFKQGLSGNVLGLNSWIHPDDINTALVNAVSAQTENEAQKHMQQCQKLLIDKHCILYPVGVLYSVYIKNKQIHDDGINDIYYTQSTLWKAWLSK